MGVSLGDSQLEQIEAKLGTARIVSEGTLQAPGINSVMYLQTK